MDKRNELVFSCNGRTFWFVFSNGEKSETFHVKEDGYITILQYHEECKITDAERDRMLLGLVNADHVFSLHRKNIVYLKMLDDSCKAAKIICKSCETPPFNSKHEGILYVEQLRKINFLSEKEFEKLSNEVVKSKLP